MKNMKEHIYILSAKRTPVGRFQGAFKNVSAPKLGAAAIKSAVQESGVNTDHIDEVIMGEVLTAGVGQSPARQACIHAGLSENTKTFTVNNVCGSGLKSIVLAVQSLMTTDAQVIVAGGQENMTQAPYLLPQARDGMRMGNKEVVDSMITDGLWDPYNQIHMGNCAELCAKEFSITREQQDAFALESYNRTHHAIETGLFKSEITSVSVTNGKIATSIEEDEEPHAVDLSKMSSLRPAFEKDGTITAANASKISDGAAAVVLACQTYVEENKLKPMARIVGFASHAQNPKWFTTAPIAAIEKALKISNLNIKDIDLFEINEAFSVVTLATMKNFEIDHAKVNIHGGACALGHPLGASGARILTTLVHALKKSEKRYGLATLCIGGGEAIAMIIENIS
jgi:acetyl-CoA C-acetyltransferase